MPSAVSNSVIRNALNTRQMIHVVNRDVGASGWSQTAVWFRPDRERCSNRRYCPAALAWPDAESAVTSIGRPPALNVR
jgi:hypothetical protein